LSECITIRPLGPVEQDVLLRISACVERTCGISCRIAAGLDKPDYALHQERRQYDSKIILKRLLDHPDATQGIIAVTHADLFVPILKCVFGLAQIGGTCSIISLHRLRPQFYSSPPDRELFLGRVEKTAIHELGHSFGLTHCRERRCVMFSSTRIEDTDQKLPSLCHTCSELLRWHMENRVMSHRP